MTSIAVARPIALRNDRQVLLLPVVLIGAFASLMLCPRVSGNANLMGVFTAITAIFTVLYGLVLAMVASGRRLPTYSVLFRPSHYVQALVHSSIYAYWGWYWRPVYHEAILILAQIIFVYVLDCLIAWLRGRNWQLGFGPFPIIFSTNLFLWFKDDWYAWQFVMVAVGLFGKMLITWNRDGRRTHIFNPSALSLSIASTILIFSASTGVSWGNEIANTLTYPHYIYVWIFLVGLIVQYLFNVTLVTLSAAVSLLLLGAAWYAMTGVYFFFTSDIPIAVFLGLHLLVTDPVTSPRSDLGKIMFGGLYGLSVMVLFSTLDNHGVPPFYDKLLAVPLLNLSVRWLDGISRAPFLKRLAAVFENREPRRLNHAYMGIWIVIFAVLLSAHRFGASHPGRSADYWEQACKDKRLNGCRNFHDLVDIECVKGKGAACAKMAVMYRDGVGAQVDAERAYLFIQRACRLGYQPACDRTDEFLPPPDIPLFPGQR
jgi:hypothetical protein